MRAIYLPHLQNDLAAEKEITLSDIHHLVNVVRVQENEEVLLLNGKGLKAIARINSITKKQVQLKILSQQKVDPQLNISLAQCIVKKEAMEDILRASVETGLIQVYPLQSQYSWHLFLPETRIEAILGHAAEQSNNPNLPLVSSPTKLIDFNFKEFDHVLYFTSNSEAQRKAQPISKTQKILLLIGPEGGLAPAEEELLFKQSNFSFFHLPTPILRAPTAVLVATGFTLSKI